MGLFDKFTASMGIQTAANADLIDVAAQARLPEDHPVVQMVDRAATRGLGASDIELRRLFGDPTGLDSSAPAAPRAETPARYNWVARRALDQIMPRMGESHVDARLPEDLRVEMVSVVAADMDPFGDTKGSILSARMQGESAISKRLVNYLQSSPDDVAQRASRMLEDSSDSDLSMEFEQVPGTARRRIPQEDRGRRAWIEERVRLEHALSRAGVMAPRSVIEAAARLDMPAGAPSDAPLMARPRHHELVAAATVEAERTDALSDMDLRFRFKELGGMASADIPDGPARGDWVVGMLVEEAQTKALSSGEQRSLDADRRSVEATLPRSTEPARPLQSVSVRYSMAATLAQAAGI